MPISRRSIAFLTSLLLLFLFGGWCFYGFWAVQGVETPPYSVLSREDSYEVRHYDELILASVTVSGDLDTATNAGFRRVAAYIFGDNALEEKIAMTAPVVVQASPRREDLFTVSFVLPSEYSMDELPLPNDAELRVEAMDNLTFAVQSFSGFTKNDDVQERMEIFRELLEEDGLVISGELILAQYNPPFTPWFMRRNELWAKLLPER